MIYVYRCEKCKEVQELCRPISARNDIVECTCGQTMKRDVFPTRMNINVGNLYGRVCTTLPGDPVYIRNKSHFSEVCKQISDKTGNELRPV